MEKPIYTYDDVIFYSTPGGYQRASVSDLMRINGPKIISPGANTSRVLAIRFDMEGKLTEFETMNSIYRPRT